MLKKIMAVVICVLMVAIYVPFTVTAAESAAFKICVVSQDSKSAVVTIDFAGGTGFNAFDADVKYNNLKLTLEDCQFASGFAAFKQYSDKNGGAMIFDANSSANPVKVSVATLEPFKAIDEDGAILKLSFSKIKDVNISEEDVSLKITNCQNADGTDIKTSVAYDLKTGSSSASSETVIEGGKLPEEEAKISENGELEKTTVKASDGETSETGNGTAVNAQSQNQGDVSADSSAKEQSSSAESSEQVNKGLSNSKKTILVIVIAVVCVGCIAGLCVIIIKNKKSSNGIED